MKTTRELNRRAGGATAWILWSLLALIVILIFVMIVLPKPKEVVDEKTPAATPVKVMELQAHRMPDRVQFPGRLVPESETYLSAEKAGRVVEINVEEGDQVQAGQLLIKLDDRLWKASLERAQLELEDAERNLTRWVELEKAGAVSGQSFEDFQLRRNMAKVALEETKVFVEQCAVLAPLNGRVEERLVDLGEFANEGAPVLKLVKTDVLKHRIDIPERDILFVKAGEELPFTVAALQGQTFTGRVTFVAASANPQSNAYRVECQVDNAAEVLKAGMLTQALLTRGWHEQALAVPLASVIPDKGENVVFTVDGDHAVRHTVIIDAIIGTEALLARGVPAGAQVVVEGHRTLIDGAVVVVQ